MYIIQQPNTIVSYHFNQTVVLSVVTKNVRLTKLEISPLAICRTLMWYSRYYNEIVYSLLLTWSDMERRQRNIHYKYCTNPKVTHNSDFLVQVERFMTLISPTNNHALPPSYQQPQLLWKLQSKLFIALPDAASNLRHFGKACSRTPSCCHLHALLRNHTVRSVTTLTNCDP